MRSSQRPRGRHVLRLALAVVAFTALVALAAKETRLLLPPATLEGGGVWAVRIAGVAAALAGAVGLLIQRKRLGAGGGGGGDPAMVGLRTAGVIMGLLAFVALLNPPVTSRDEASLQVRWSIGGQTAPERSESGESTSRSREGGGEFTGEGGGMPGGGAGSMGMGSPGTEQSADEPEESLLRRIPGFVWAVFFVLLAGLLVLALRSRGERDVENSPEAIAPGAEHGKEEEGRGLDAGVEASLAEVTQGRGEPRERITAAYRRLLATLAEAGAPRRPEEAPYEHLRRTLGSLGVRPEPLHRLAGLYVLAQFGGRPVTEAEGSEAAAALKLSLAGLRALDRTGGVSRFSAFQGEAAS